MSEDGKVQFYISGMEEYTPLEIVQMLRDDPYLINKEVTEIVCAALDILMEQENAKSACHTALKLVTGRLDLRKIEKKQFEAAEKQNYAAAAGIREFLSEQPKNYEISHPMMRHISTLRL